MQSRGWVRRGVSALVALVLAIMMVLPVAQILARKLFHNDVPGAASYTQNLTLWAGFLGALLASMAGRHLSLSTVNLLHEGRARVVAQVFRGAVTAAVLLLLTYGSLDLVLQDRGHTGTLPGGLPIWWVELVMPATLAVMTLHALVRAPAGWLGRAVSLGACLVVVLLWIPDFGSRAAETPVVGRFLDALGHFNLAHLHVTLWLGAIVLLLAFLLGTPVFIVMAGMAMLFFYAQQTPIVSVPTNTFRLVTNPTLPAVPLLTLAGFVLAAGGASQRLVAAYRSLLGWLPAGMGLMVLSVCVLFTAFTGASGVTILAMGGLVLPLLIEEKYPEGFSLGLITTGGSLGLLLPPSLPVILYSVVAQVDIKKLFIAGLVPSGMIIGMVALYTVVVGVRARAPRHPFVLRDALGALWAAKWDLGLPLLVVGAIVSGVATIVESAAIAAVYAVIVEVVVFRNLRPVRDLPRVMASGAVLVGSVLILMGFALGLTDYMVDAQIPDALLAWVQTHIHSAWAFLLILNALLLVLGSVFEMYSAIIVLAPLIVPLGVAFAIDPVHLGIVFLANLELGFILPPMGLNLFLSATRFGQPLPSLYRRTLPFLGICAVAVLLVTYLPSVTTGVLSFLGID